MPTPADRRHTADLAVLGREIAREFREADREFREEVISKLAILPDLAATLAHHEKILIRGNGKPAVTERLALIESEIANSAKSTDRFWGVAAAVIGGIGTVVGALVTRFLA